MHATSKTQETHLEHVDEQLDAFEISIFDAADKFLHGQVTHGFVSAQQHVDTLHKPGKQICRYVASTTCRDITIRPTCTRQPSDYIHTFTQQHFN